MKILMLRRLVAEREGFEPSDRLMAVNGFRDRPVQPLRHLSVFKNLLFFKILNANILHHFRIDKF